MEDFITNILVGVRTWVNGKLEDITYVISSHINALTSRMDTAETKLTGIETGAQVNVIETVKVDNVALTPTDKTVNIDLSGKVDKVAGKGLSTEDFTTSYMTKLDGIETGAQVNVIDTITLNGSSKGVTVTGKTVDLTITPGSSISVDSNDKVLTLSSNVLSSQISLTHDSTAHKIKLLGKGAAGSEQLISEFSTDDFIKDGMLDKTAIYTYTATGWEKTSGETITITETGVEGHEYLVFQWNSDEQSKVNILDATSLIDEYTAGTGLTLTNHEFSLNAANASTIGGVKPGDGMAVDGNGVITVSYATSSVAGAVKVGSGLSIDASTGVLSATGTSVSYADTTTYGIVKIGDGIDVADGVIGVAKSDTYTYGLVKAGDGLTCVDGVISVTYVSVAQVLAVLSAEDSPAA